MGLNCGIYHKAALLMESSATGLYEDDIDILSRLAHAHFLDKDYKAAATAFKRLKAIKSPIKPIELALEYIDALLETSDLKAVESELIELVQTTENIEATFKLGMFYKEVNNMEGALKYFNLLIINTKHIPNQHKKKYQTWIEEAEAELLELTRNQ